jgi:hypothetical protein
MYALWREATLRTMQKWDGRKLQVGEMVLQNNKGLFQLSAGSHGSPLKDRVSNLSNVHRT